MPGEVTELLKAARDGDSEARNRLVALLYVDLRRLARRVSPYGPDCTMNTTSLVHECYLRLLEAGHVEVNDRAHFFNLAARIMRQLLCDYARQRLAAKRGGGAVHLPLDDEKARAEESEAEQFLAVDQALERLGKRHPRQVQVVECRYFAGLSEAETAEALEMSLRTVQRDWRSAREWLSERLSA